MPLLINEVEVEILPSGMPEPTGDTQSDLMPLDPGQQELARLLELMDERRARLTVD